MNGFRSAPSLSPKPISASVWKLSSDSLGSAHGLFVGGFNSAELGFSLVSRAREISRTEPGVRNPAHMHRQCEHGQ
jgi:hypothetical protein